ncbi:MAG: hypothetical protein V4541_02640 [Bacteroidota bacterium]
MSQRPFNKEDFTKNLNDPLFGFSNEQIDSHAQMMAKKTASIKSGEDVIHLDYFHGILDQTDVQNYESGLKKVGIRLSYFDKSGIVFNSIDEYTLQVFFGVSYPIVKLIGEGMLTNVVWEALKAVTIVCWKKVKSKNNQTFGKKMNFGLKMKFKDSKLTDFKLNTDFSEETTVKALGLIFNYMSSQKSEPIKDGLPDFCEFDETDNSWHKVDVMEEFRKKAKEQEAKRALKSNRDNL